MENVTLPVCRDCPFLIANMNTTMILKGIKLSYGERACEGKRNRPRKFKPSDPKERVPKWCPRRKDPCELRYYYFKDSYAYSLYMLLRRNIGPNVSVSGYAYKAELEQSTTLSPKEFWTRQKSNALKELLGFSPLQYGVIEIDDGLKPYFFFVGDHGLKVLPYFKPPED